MGCRIQIKWNNLHQRSWRNPNTWAYLAIASLNEDIGISSHGVHSRGGLREGRFDYVWWGLVVAVHVSMSAHTHTCTHRRRGRTIVFLGRQCSGFGTDDVVRREPRPKALRHWLLVCFQKTLRRRRRQPHLGERTVSLFYCFLFLSKVIDKQMR